MAYIIECECPKCHKTASGYDEITELFGWRVNKGKTIPQSYCKECRAKSITVKVKE